MTSASILSGPTKPTNGIKLPSQETIGLEGSLTGEEEERIVRGEPVILYGQCESCGVEVVIGQGIERYQCIDCCDYEEYWEE